MKTPRSIAEYAREWQDNAEADAFWVILTHPDRYGRTWDAAAFYATGEEEIGRVFGFMERTGIAAPTGSFLDFGCGAGRVSGALRRRFAAGSGVDISPKMVELAREHVPGVSFLVNQADSLAQIPDDSVDFVYSHIVLQHIPVEYQRRYVDEFLRVLRPGGLAVFQAPAEILNQREERAPAGLRLRAALKRALPFLVPLKRFLLPPQGFHHDFRYEMHALPRADVERIVAARGCRVEGAPATNSCEPDHNGRLEFFDAAARRAALAASGLPNRYLSLMYFVRRPAGADGKDP